MIIDVDINNLSNSDYEEIRNLLYKNLIVVLKRQTTCPATYTGFVNKIGRIANHSQFVFTQFGEKVDPPGYFIDPYDVEKPEYYPVQRVTGKKIDDQYTGIFATGTLDWHANLNGLDRADGVALQGYEGCKNTSTIWLNTNLAYNDLDFKEDLLGVYCEYEYSPEVWSDGAPQRQIDAMKVNASKYKMWLIQENKIGVKGIYFYTNNRCKIITEDNTLYQRLYDHMFQEKYMYHHWWDIGDIVLSDQLLTLHKRGQDDPNILANRILHRITFKISNENGFISNRNKI